MTPKKLVRISDDNYFESTRIFCEQACQSGASKRLDGMLLTSSGTPLEWFNVAFVTGRSPAPDRLIDEAARWYRERGEPWILRVRAGFDPAAERAAEAAGMRYTDDVPGMVLAPMPPPAPDAAPVEIVPVRDERDCATGAQVLAAAFGMPPAASGQLFSSRLAGAHDVRTYVGRIDGAIVATSMLIAVGGVAGVWAVATLDAYRGRGIGAATTRHAVDEGARLGCTSACLQASEMGQPVYERMGFRTVAQYLTYVQKEVWEKMQR